MATSTESSLARRDRQRRLAEFWYYFSENKGAVIGLVVFSILVFVAIFAPLIAPHDPSEQYRDALLVPPFWQEGGQLQYLLGTDAIGRDIFSRLVHGARYSLFIGVVVVSLALVGGSASGSSRVSSAAGSIRSSCGSWT
ncbi:MAG: hypothetical protein R3C97_06780 [Geminicoccaceae bacterium]